MTFETNWLEWSFERTSRQFRMYVVEPKAYEPQKHGEVFDAVLRDLFYAGYENGDLAGDVSSVIRESVEADLIVFPEAFLAAEDLIQAMKGFVAWGLQFCVHVGLRPDLSKPNHLFSIQEIDSLLNRLKTIANVNKKDLSGFERWFRKQKSGNFNLGCMFLVDHKGNLRVCVHPKAVRAGVEFSALPDEHMTEANLLSLVTLVPSDSRYMSITIQPLICSDALSLPRDAMISNPINAFSDSSAANFPKLPADHVDIVSLSLCTPVREVASGALKQRRWKPEFESAFLDAAKLDACFRHHFASFVMANFEEIGAKKGGLSGACIPMPFSVNNYPDGVSAWTYEKDDLHLTDGWKCITGSEIEQRAKTSRQSLSLNLVCLDAISEPAQHVARALGFTLSRLVRDNAVSGWFPGLTRLDVRAVRDETMNATE